MVWLNVHPSASLIEAEPMGESEATVNVFEAPRSMLLSPEKLSAPFEVMDFFVESGALPGAASLASVEAKTDAMINKVKGASLLESLPAMNIHVAQGGSAVSLSEAQQTAIKSQRARLVQTLKARSQRISALRKALSQ